jgi:AICAR transformylase/IMP cyclohydrolase PurH
VITVTTEVDGNVVVQVKVHLVQLILEPEVAAEAATVVTIQRHPVLMLVVPQEVQEL